MYSAAGVVKLLDNGFAGVSTTSPCLSHGSGTAMESRVCSQTTGSLVSYTRRRRWSFVALVDTMLIIV